MVVILSVCLLCLLTSSQGSPNSHPSEELLKQPDYSDKIKQMLGNPQGQPQGTGGGSLQWSWGKQGFTDAEEYRAVNTRQEMGGKDWTERALLCQVGLRGSVGCI